MRCAEQRRRSRTYDGKGVTIPSQIRYVNFFEWCSRRAAPGCVLIRHPRSMLRKEPPVPASNPLFTTQITISTIPKAVHNVSVDVWFVLTRCASLPGHRRALEHVPRVLMAARWSRGSSPYKDGETYSSKGKVPRHASRHTLADSCPWPPFALFCADSAGPLRRGRAEPHARRRVQAAFR